MHFKFPESHCLYLPCHLIYHWHFPPVIISHDPKIPILVLRYRSLYLRAFSPYRVCIGQRQNMDALAGTWFLSGKKTDDLYGGKTEEIVKELREWVKARLARNKAIILLLWDFFKIVDAIALLGQQYGSQDARIDPFKAKYVKNLERVKVRQFHLFEIARTEPAS